MNEWDRVQFDLGAGVALITEIGICMRKGNVVGFAGICQDCNTFWRWGGFEDYCSDCV